MLILHSYNPLNPSDYTEHIVPDHSTPNQVVKMLGFDTRRPILCIVNGKPWGRTEIGSNWDTPLPTHTVVAFVQIPGYGLGTVFLVVQIILLVVALGMSIYAMVAAKDNASVEKTSTIYSFSSGNNRLRIGEPFAEQFGRFRTFPDLAQQSYVQNINNDQYMYFLGIIGVGEYEIEGVFVNKTPLLDYADSEFTILTPGESSTLIPDVVWTSSEVSGQDLDTDYITYVVSKPGTEAYFIEYDITFPGGLREIK